jgi:hypothetical protein
VPTPLRAFLMLRTEGGGWAVSVHRDLESLLAAWRDRAEPSATVGVIHVGFDRPPSQEFEPLARDYPGRALVTAAARFALPANFHASEAEVGRVGSLPVFLGTRGWGYLIHDDAGLIPARNPVGASRAAEGWVREFLAGAPDSGPVLQAAGIWNDADYLAREAELPPAIRCQAGLYRFRQLVATGRDDPCAFARAAPPWLAERTFASICLTVRVANVFVHMGVTKVGDLAGRTLNELLHTQNFGRKSLKDLVGSLEVALAEGPSGIDAKLDNASDVTLLASIRRSLLKYDERERDIIRRRMGLDAVAETLQQIGDDYGVTRERVRQIESKAIKRLRREEYWDDLLTKKLTILLHDRDFPLPALGVEAADPWFAGMAEFPSALRYVLVNICESRAGVVSIDGVDYYTFLRQEQWEATLREARRLLEAGVGRGWSDDHCRSVVQGLLPETSREFRGLLWEKAAQLCHFADAQGVRLFTSYGRGVEHIVEAVLGAAERPLHFSEIAQLASARAGREIDLRRAHNAAAAVGLLMGRGTYGVERHLPLNREALEALGEEAEEIVASGPVGRQWHASELLAALGERGSNQVGADKYLIDIALQRSHGLERLGRMMWKAGHHGDVRDELRIDLRQAIIALLQQAGRPLRAHEIRQRLVALRGVNEHFHIVVADPLIRVGTGLWGLNDRDVSVKRPDQPALLDGLVDILRRRRFAIHASELVSAGMSATLLSASVVFSLVAADARMRVNQAQYLYLADWGDPRRESVSEAVEAVISSASSPLRFDEIVACVEARVRRSCERTAISACLQAIEAVLDEDTGRWSKGVREDFVLDDELTLTA